MACKLSLAVLAQRLAFKQWTGAAASSVGTNYNLSYTLSDVVDASHYWLVLYASAVFLNGSGSNENNVSLWLLSPGVGPRGGAYANDPFFAGSTAAVANGPPVGGGAIRIDDLPQVTGGTGLEESLQSEVVLIRRKIVVPPNCRLMAYSGSYGLGVGGSLGEQFQLKLAYVNMSIGTDDCDVEF